MELSQKKGLKMGKNDMTIYTDRIRTFTVIIVHLLFIFGLGWLFLNSTDVHFLLRGLILVVTALFVYITYTQIKILADKKVLYQIKEEGISDFTQTSLSLTIPWEKVIRVEMFADSTDFQIIVTGSTDELPVAYIVINRFSFRWSVFKKIWQTIKHYAEQHNIEVIDTRLINKE